MKKILEEIKELGYNLLGLKDNEIKKIESFYDIQLPDNYILFLKEMGRDGGGFMRGEDCFFDRIFDLKDYATDLLEEDESDFELSNEHFVFYSHQGYIFAFFNTKINDSPIFVYEEGDLKPNIKYQSLESFFEEQISNIKNYRNRPNSLDI